MKLFRAFDKKEHLDAFLSGNIRFGLVRNYRDTEHTKSADADELIFHYKINNIDEYKEFGNSVYALCTSTNANHIKSKFGKYIAEITDFNLFKAELLKAISEQKLALHGTILCDYVSYDKHASMDSCNLEIGIKEIIFQKSKNFSSESEYRFALILMGNSSEDANDAIFVQLKNTKFLESI